jgi:hypothetical protein
MIDTNVMELVLDYRRQLGGSFEYCNTFCTNAQAVAGGNGARLEEKTQGITDKQHRERVSETDGQNVTFVYIVLSSHMICI